MSVGGPGPLSTHPGLRGIQGKMLRPNTPWESASKKRTMHLNLLLGYATMQCTHDFSPAGLPYTHHTQKYD